MKLYLVQEDYWTVEPDSYSDGSDLDYKKQNIIGIYPNIDLAKQAIEYECEHNVWDNPHQTEFNVYEIDTNKVSNNGFEMNYIKVFD